MVSDFAVRLKMCYFEAIEYVMPWMFEERIEDE